MKPLLAAWALAAAPAFADVVAEPETLFLPPHGDEGCWVSFFSAPGFRGESAQLAGRTYVKAFETGPVVNPDLEAVGGESFLKEVRSVVVGPHARLVGYEEEGFGGDSITLRPGRHVVDVDRVGLQRARSLKVFCEP
jgi:hypothetical protein